MEKSIGRKGVPGGLDRREFIRYGAAGLGALVLGGCGLGGGGGEGRGGFRGSLTITEANVEMVDGTPVYHWVFADQGGVRFPGPVIVTFAGRPVTLDVTNALDEVHEFRVVGAGAGGANVDSGPIGPGQTVSVQFAPVAAGTYLYLDPRNAPVHRVMGLHGAMIVLPAGSNTPYSNPTPMVQQLFNDLGTSPEFPGDPWISLRPPDKPPDPKLPPEAEPFLYRTRLWVLTDVDPIWNALVAAGATAEPGGQIDPAELYRTFKPDYFLINGKSGSFAVHDSKMSLIDGFIGEPMLIRVLNAGLQVNSIHMHGNHFYILSVNNQVLTNPVFIDTMTVQNLESDARLLTAGGGFTEDGARVSLGGSRVDWLFPFIRPPDIPGDPAIPLRDLLVNEWGFVLGGVPQSPLTYPMHDHVEPSQTAIGGNYPQGRMSDIVFYGDVDKQFFPKPV